MGLYPAPALGPSARVPTRRATPFPTAFPFNEFELAAEGQRPTPGSARLVIQRLIAELEASERRYRRLVEAAPIGIGIVHDGRLIFANQTALALVGAPSLESLANLDVFALVHDDDREAVIERARLLFEGPDEERPPLLARVRQLNGGEIELELTGVLVEHAGTPAIQLLLRDVTVERRERAALQRSREAEEALRWRDALMRAVNSASPQALLVVDNPSTAVLYCNHRFVELWHLEAHADAIATGQVSGKELAELVAPQVADSETFLRGFIPLRDPESRDSIDMELSLRDGRVLRMVSAQIRGDDDRFLGRMYLLEDATHRVRLEMQLRQSQKMEAVGRLAGGVAHDFNNLLTAIHSYTDFLLQDMPTSDARRADVQEIMHAAQRAAGLTRQLLMFSRQQRVQPRSVRLDELLAEMNRMLGRLIGEDVQLVTACEAGTPAIVADPGQIEQVILNLVVNARDALPSGGTIHVETRRVEVDEARPAAIGTLRPGSYAAIVVTDDGVGIEPALLSQIFEPFFTTKEVGKGTGLGLATVYGIAQQCGGNVEVASTPGAGSTFTVYLPAAPTSDGRTASEPASAPNAGHERILLVEDEETVRRLARRALQARGYTVLEAPCAETALKLFAEHGTTIDVLVTDVIMPVTSGYELAKQLRAQRPELPVLFMSGYTADALPASLDLSRSFLPKPFTPQQLAAAVRAVLDDARDKKGG